MVVVEQAEGRQAAHQRMELEMPLLDELPAAGMGGVDHRHLIGLRHVVDGVHQGEEIVFQINVFLPVRGNEDIFALFQSQPFQHVAFFNAGHGVVQHLPHGGAGNEDGLAVNALAEQIAAAVFGVGHVDVGNMIHDLAVDHFADVPVPAAVARLHMEDRHLQPLGGNGAQGGVGIAQHQQRVGLFLLNDLVAGCDDIAHGLSQIAAHRVQIIVRRPQFQLLEENIVQVGVVVLAGMHQNMIEIPIGGADDGGQPDDLRPGAQNGHQFQLFHQSFSFASAGVSSTGRRRVSGCAGSKTSLAHMRVSMSVSPVFSMLWV